MDQGPTWRARSKDQARFNMDAAYYFQVVANQAGPQDSHAVLSATSDQASVMFYSFTDDFYKSGTKSPCKPAGTLGYATTLSRGDRRFYLANYSNIPSPF